jgi:hypothetical protein
MATHALVLRFVLGLLLMAPQATRAVPGSTPHWHVLVAPRAGACRMDDELMHLRGRLLMTIQTPSCRDSVVLFMAALAI